MEIFTIGSSGTTGRRLIDNLKSVGATSLVDTRVHPNSQLAGFAKQDNLEFLLELTIQIPLVYAERFCPPEELLRDYRGKRINWDQYASGYLKTLQARNAIESIDFRWGERPVLLCSEQDPSRCHRSLAANWISDRMLDVKITHLLN